MTLYKNIKYLILWIRIMCLFIINTNHLIIDTYIYESVNLYIFR